MKLANDQTRMFVCASWSGDKQVAYTLRKFYHNMAKNLRTELHRRRKVWNIGGPRFRILGGGGGGKGGDKFPAGT